MLILLKVFWVMQVLLKSAMLSSLAIQSCCTVRQRGNASYLVFPGLLSIDKGPSSLAFVQIDGVLVVAIHIDVRCHDCVQSQVLKFSKLSAIWFSYLCGYRVNVSRRASAFAVPGLQVPNSFAVARYPGKAAEQLKHVRRGERADT